MDSARRLAGLTTETSATGRGIRVGVLDTGIDTAHPDLIDCVNLELSTSFATRSDILDRNGHGTHVAGIIGGNGRESNQLYRGIAPECELVIYKIAEQKNAPEGNAIAAIESAMQDGVDIINYSHGYAPDRDRVGQAPWIWPEAPSLLEEAFKAAADSGVLCVVAAGNGGPTEGSITRPGGLECVLTVGALGPDGQPLPMSSRGPFRRSVSIRAGGVTRYDRTMHSDARSIRKPDIACPGLLTAPRAARCLHTDDPDSGTEDPYYVMLRGSSQATAIASGLAALLLQQVREQGIELGPNSIRTLQRLFAHAAIPIVNQLSEDVGAGLPFWPNLLARLQDFANDHEYRDQVLHDKLGLI